MVFATPMSEAPQAADPQSGRVARLLSVVRKLIDYARELSNTLRSQPGALSASDIAAVLVRITRGLHRAEALEARIVNNPARLETKRKPQSRVSRPKLAREPKPRQPNPAAPLLAHLPTPEEIAADVRRRPIGAVIADICRDLGIMPNHPLWPELSDLIMRYGGNWARLAIDTIRDRRLRHPALNGPHVPWPDSFQPSPAVTSTGPPL